MALNYHDLKYFIEVSQVLNLSRAAERLGLSQPSLSLAIQRLEMEVDAKLLRRGPKGVQLSPAGAELAASAKVFLQNWEDLKKGVANRSDEVIGELHVGCHPSVAIYSLPYVLPQLLSQYPRLNIKLTHDLSRKITESVISARVDVGIVVNPVRHPDLVLKKLSDDQVTLWQSPEMSAGNRDVLICDPDLLQTQSLLKKVQKSQVTFKRFLHSSNLEVIRELTESGAGIGILPSRAARAGARDRLEKIKNAPFFKDEIHLIFRTENRKLKTIEAFAKWVVEHFSSES